MTGSVAKSVPLRHDLQMAQRRNQARREVIAQLHRRRLDDLRLRQGKVDGVVSVDATKHDGVGYTEISEGKDVVECSGR